MDWSPELIARLTQLWGEGLATAEIGRQLGISKNAVVGKAHRIDLPGRPNPIKTGGPRAYKRPSAPYGATKRTRASLEATNHLAERGAVPGSMRSAYGNTKALNPVVVVPRIRVVRTDVTVLGDGKCCYPLWTEDDEVMDKFCGERTVAKSPYCPGHHIKCRIGVPVPKKAAT